MSGRGSRFEVAGGRKAAFTRYGQVRRESGHYDATFRIDGDVPGTAARLVLRGPGKSVVTSPPCRKMGRARRFHRAGQARSRAPRTPAQGYIRPARPGLPRRVRPRRTPKLAGIDQDKPVAAESRIKSAVSLVSCGHRVAGVHHGTRRNDPLAGVDGDTGPPGQQFMRGKAGGDEAAGTNPASSAPAVSRRASPPVSGPSSAFTDPTTTVRHRRRAPTRRRGQRRRKTRSSGARRYRTSHPRSRPP